MKKTQKQELLELCVDRLIFLYGTRAIEAFEYWKRHNTWPPVVEKVQEVPR